MKRYRAIVILIFIYFAMSNSSYSHPHSFIDLQTRFISDDKNVTALAMTWTLDQITSADLLYDLIGKAADDAAWQQQATVMMQNIIDHDYFSQLYRNQQSIALSGTAHDYHLSRQGLQAIFSFTVDLQQPQPIALSHYVLFTFEPTFFVDMVYQQQHDIQLAEAMQNQCQLTLSKPEPSASLLAYALALDEQGESALKEDDGSISTTDLGLQFAQQVTIRCQ